MKLAKTKHRFAAYVVDFIITGIITLIICLLYSFDVYKVFVNGVILGKDTTLSFSDIFTFYRAIFISTVLICAYYTLLPFLFDGQTLGKKLFRIKVVNEKGEKASLKRLFIREIFGKLFLNFTTLFLGNIVSLILIINRKDRKSIADILAATIVVDVEKK
jgi:uncharacterized RDD family membrane protein YckC